jgi:hypothetical protein
MLVTMDVRHPRRFEKNRNIVVTSAASGTRIAG